MRAIGHRGRLCGLLVCALAAIWAAPAGAGVANPPGPATLRLEVVAAGEDLRLPPEDAEITVIDLLSGDELANVTTPDLLTGSGARCPGVGALCAGDVPLTVLALGTELVLDVATGPGDRLPVFSGDCDGNATVTGDTRARLRLAAGETKTCRVTFVRPDDGSVGSSDSVLFVEKTYDHDPNGAGLPDQTLRLDAAGGLVASRPTGSLRELATGASCPRFGRPTCEWAVALDYGGLPQPLVLSESANPDWLPVFGGACDARGRLPVDNRGGEAVRCTVDNVHLEAQTGTARNAVLRLEVVAFGATALAQHATLAVRSFDGDQLSMLGTIGMVGPTGAPCAALGAAGCTGDVGVEVDPDPRGSLTERVVVSIESAPAGADVAFSGDCAGTPNAMLDLGLGRLQTCRVTFTLHTPAPTAVLDAPSPVGCGTSVGFSGSRSTAAAGASIHRYRWQFGDGSPLLETSGSSVAHTYGTAGGYAARLVVVDDLGQESAPAQRTILVGTTGVPTAVLSAPSLVLPGRTFTASGAGSTDPESACGDRIHSYRFTVDGGAPVETPDPSVTLGPLAAGTHTVTLVVRDTFGNESAPVTRSVQVPGLPTAVLDAPSSVACATAVAFSGSRSTAGAGASIHRYRWQFGDGSPLVETVESSRSHTYATAGAYLARLVVVDDLGQESAPVQRTVLVGTMGVPTAVLSAPSLVLLGRTFTASGAGSTDPEAACGDRIHSYRFTVDAGAPIETPDPSVTLGPLAPGTHTVTLVVRDTFGNDSAPVTRSVQVPGLPTAVLDAPATAACGATVTLSGARSTAGPGASVHRYRWDFGDGSPLLETVESSVTHAYATARGYVTRLVVVDTVGQESAAVQRTVAVGTTGAPTAVLTTPAVVLDGRTFTASGASSTDPQSGCGDRIVEYRFTVDGGAPIVTSSSSLTLGPLAAGTHTVTLVVQDSFGNLSSPVTRSLRVDAAPVIGAKGDVVAESKLAPIAVFYTAPVAKDAFDGTVPVTCVSASGAKFASGTTRVLCTARDSAGNATTSAFNVVVRLPTTTGAVTKPGDTTKVLAAVTSGQRVRVNAGGFAPGSQLSLVFVGADGTTRPLGTATAGEDGRFDVRVTMPKRLPRGEGQVTALGTGPDGEEFVRAWLLDVPH